MPATETDASRGTPATDRVRLRFDVIDAWAAERGAYGDTAVAALLDIDRTTVFRYRTGRISPTIATAMGIAAKIGVDLGSLIENPAVA